MTNTSLVCSYWDGSFKNLELSHGCICQELQILWLILWHLWGMVFAERPFRSTRSTWGGGLPALWQSFVNVSPNTSKPWGLVVIEWLSSEGRAIGKAEIIDDRYSCGGFYRAGNWPASPIEIALFSALRPMCIWIFMAWLISLLRIEWYTPLTIFLIEHFKQSLLELNSTYYYFSLFEVQMTIFCLFLDQTQWIFLPLISGITSGGLEGS